MLENCRQSAVRWGFRLACAVALAAPVLAQDKKKEEMPPWDVQALERGYGWVPWVFAFLFAAAVVAIAFKNPHRTHLD